MAKTDLMFNELRHNEFQGTSRKLLFVCTGGYLRSPTAAAEAVKLGCNARSCGTDVERALIPISVGLVEWANAVVFMTEENFLQAQRLFQPAGTHFLDTLAKKSVILDIPDMYDYGDPELVQDLKRVFPELLTLQKFLYVGPLRLSV